MGRHQRAQPALHKVGLGPALMIRSASPSLSPAPALKWKEPSLECGSSLPLFRAADSSAVVIRHDESWRAKAATSRRTPKFQGFRNEGEGTKGLGAPPRFLHISTPPALKWKEPILECGSSLPLSRPEARLRSTSRQLAGEGRAVASYRTLDFLHFCPGSPSPFKTIARTTRPVRALYDRVKGFGAHGRHVRSRESQNWARSLPGVSLGRRKVNHGNSGLES